MTHPDSDDDLDDSDQYDTHNTVTRHSLCGWGLGVGVLGVLSRLFRTFPSFAFLSFSPPLLPPRSGSSNAAKGLGGALLNHHSRSLDSLDSKYTKMCLRPNPSFFGVFRVDVMCLVVANVMLFLLNDIKRTVYYRVSVTLTKCYVIILLHFMFSTPPPAVSK